MSWLNVNLNESLSSIKGQLTNLASNVLAEATEDASDGDKGHVNELRKLVSEQEIEIRRLQQENSEISKRISANNAADDWSWEVPEKQLGAKRSEVFDNGEVEKKIRDLEREKIELEQSLEQLDQDCQCTTDKLVAMKDELQTENNNLKLQQEDLAKENSYLRSNIDVESKKLKRLELEKTTRDEEIQRLRLEIEEYRNEINDKKGLGVSDIIHSLEVNPNKPTIEEFNRLEALVTQYNNQIAVYEEELAKLRDSKSTEASGDSSRQSSITVASSLKFVNVLYEAMTKMGLDVDRSSTSSTHDSVDVGVAEEEFENYRILVENIVKSIADYKWKCESLEEEKKNLFAEKNLILAEKNNEIDKLLDSLTAKTQDLKHYESECSQLSQNNEALIAQLDDSKQADMKLHTIPEMNEHLDGQLEKCYKRIEQLESGTELRENQIICELQYQLKMTKKEMDVAKESLEEWQTNFYKLDDEYKSLKECLDTVKNRLKECDNEREELEDRIKLDNENLAEQNVNLETLQEEIETLTASINELRRDNTKFLSEREEFERKLEEAQKEITDLKEELSNEIEVSLKKDELMAGLNITVDSMEKNIFKLSQLVEVLSKDNEELVANRTSYITQYRHFKKDVEELIYCYKDLRSYQKNDSLGMQELVKEKNLLIARLCKMEDCEAENFDLISKLSDLETKFIKLQDENVALKNKLGLLQTEKEECDVSIKELNDSRNEIIQLVQQKHQESITYHAEIQRLQQLLAIEAEKSKTFETQLDELNGSGIAPEDLMAKDKEVEKLSEYGEFLRDKCANLAEALMTEQSTTKELYTERGILQEKEANLTRQLESLRLHLLESEEMYTKEIQSAETKCAEMQQKMQAIVEKEKNSSNRFTSANIRANQQVETLQTNLQLVTNQRDELKRKISDLEDQMEKQNAALCNLQIVLEQFQREKDKVIFDETERVRRQVAVEKKMQESMQATINDLKAQLAESKEGLQAAVRLTEQVGTSKRQLSAMKEEVAKLQHLLIKSEEKSSKLLNQSDGRVDKMLIKNLVIGLVNCNNALNKDQNQILKIISTVLDFNQQDIDKVNLNKKDQSTWFSNLLHPQALGGSNMSSESLSQAFVKFLEAESKPRLLPNLLDATTSTATVSTASGEPSSGSSSRKTSVRQSPLLLNEVVLPTFADFASNRNSSSILKDVLKDNSNVS